MTTTMIYHTVIAEHNVSLDKCVNNLIQEGWEPLGGAGVTAKQGSSFLVEYIYIQAMVKRNKVGTK